MKSNTNVCEGLRRMEGEMGARQLKAVGLTDNNTKKTRGPKEAGVMVGMYVYVCPVCML